ncbi:MAG: M56 family metallopeptidase [Lachnospiraceae bacterium]|nr:M56 family metallopeptidase [Lachnospiraceae bacterium]
MNIGARLLLIVCAVIGFLIWTRNAASRDAAPVDEAGSFTGRRYEPAIFPLYFLSFAIIATLGMTLMSALGIFKEDISAMLLSYLTVFIGVMVQISIYHMLLLLLTPALRKRISARGMSLLWLVPNMLYLLYYGAGHFRYMLPVFVFRIDPTWCIPVLAVWGAGTILTFSWHVVSHLRFRKMILNGAQPVSSATEAVLRREEELIAEKYPVTAVVSEAVRTPLSIGLFKRTRRIVLPVNSFTEEELSLIFRHELIHLRHQDCSTKLFLVVCACLCWWNPFSWLAMRKNAEDIELACDEMVLQQEDMGTRRCYSELLLKTAGDERGFTTCMSASARSMQYRLQNVLHPVQKGSGTLIAIMMIVILFFTCNLTGFAYRSYQAMDVLQEAAGCELREFDKLIVSYGEGALRKSVIADDAAREELYAYLSSLTVHDLTQEYDPYVSSNGLTLHFENASNDFFSVSVWPNTLVFYDGSNQTRHYYIIDTVDLAALENKLCP